MTRSAELTLYKKQRNDQQDQNQQQQKQQEPSGTLQSTKSDHFYDQIPAHRDDGAQAQLQQKDHDLPYVPLPEGAKRTAERYRDTTTIAMPLGEEPSPQPRSRMSSPSAAKAHVDPQSSRIESLTPGTRRKLQEHIVHKEEDLKVWCLFVCFKFQR
jgi:hypothetical protein